MGTSYDYERIAWCSMLVGGRICEMFTCARALPPSPDGARCMPPMVAWVVRMQCSAVHPPRFSERVLGFGLGLGLGVGAGVKRSPLVTSHRLWLAPLPDPDAWCVPLRNTWHRQPSLLPPTMAAAPWCPSQSRSAVAAQMQSGRCTSDARRRQPRDAADAVENGAEMAPRLAPRCAQTQPCLR